MKSVRIFLFLSFVCQLTLSHFILGKSDAIFTYDINKSGISCTGFTNIAMNFMKLILIQECPVVRINNNIKSNLIAMSEDNLLKIYNEPKWAESKHYFSKPEKVYSNFQLCLELKSGTNQLALDRLSGSELNIYKWDINSKIAIIDYSSIHDYTFFGNDIENYASLLKELQISSKLKIIVISDNSISEYSKIKKYFTDKELYDIPILLNPGVNNFKKEILDKLVRIFEKITGSFYLRISNDDIFNNFFEYNVQIISKKEVVITKKEKDLYGKRKKTRRHINDINGIIEEITSKRSKRGLRILEE